MSNYHHNSNTSYMIYGGSLDHPIASPPFIPYEESIRMAHSQSAHSYGSSPGSCRDSYLDNQYLQAAAAANGASPTFSAPLYFDDNAIYTTNYDDQSPVRPTDIDPRDLDYAPPMEPWVVDSDQSQRRNYDGSDTTMSSSYSSQTQYERPPTGYVKATTHAPSHRQHLSAREKGGFPCTVKGCTSKGKFSRKTDLTRHIASVHGTKRIDCQYTWCGRQGENGFTRRDHLREHLREVHQLDIPQKKQSRR